MMVPTVQPRSIENIKLTIHKTINTQETNIFGCCILPDGRLAFTHCDEQKVKVFSNKGLKDSEVNMRCTPFDLVYIREDNTLVVSSWGAEKHCITIIDIRRKQIKKTISLDSFIDGIALKDNRLIYSARE